MKPLFPRLLALLGLVAAAQAEVKLPPVISSHMVLQREQAVPIWGTAAPGEKVTVKFRGQAKEATADDQGKWAVKLDPLTAGGPDVLSVNNLQLEDVLVGEVWVGSGQSNMQMGVGSYAKGDDPLAKLAAETYPQLRLMCVGFPTWKPAEPANSQGFSALLFAFGCRLHLALKVPVGLMVGAVGGTPSGFWLSERAYAEDAACKEVVAKANQGFNYDAAKARYDEELAKWQKAADDAKAKGQREPRKPDPVLRPGECRGKVGHLYEANIRPLMPFGMKGVLWDQGESGTAIQAVDQYTLMGALIRGWRKEWAQGDFPFIYVQKPSGNGCAWDPKDPVTEKGQPFGPLPATVPNDGAYREVHIRIMGYPNTGMAISTDLGPGVHPTQKSGYGARAMQVALGMVYRRPVEYYGPVYQAHAVEDAKVRIRFTHVGKGLAVGRADKLQGFALAGEDRKFVWADAVIDGDSVVVSSAQVPKPVAVRYAWSNNSTWANLFNKDGLPAIPFRTDSW